MARKSYKGSAQPSRFASGHVVDRTYLADDLFIRPLPSLFNQSVVRSPLSELEDDRLYHPDENPPGRIASGPASSLVPRKRTSGRRSSRLLGDIQNLTFRAPRFIVKCVRRKIRDQVLHALGKTGKGSGRKLKRRKYNRNSWSNVRC